MAGCRFYSVKSVSVSATDMLACDQPAVRFEITWTRTSLLSEIMFESHKYDTILDSLTIYIPFVLFRGPSFCAKVVKGCDDSFIKSKIHSIVSEGDNTRQ
jgi:hypothetical protein